MVTNAIKKSFNHAKAKNWDCTFWAIDIHDTIVKANYKRGEIPTEFYPHAKYVMKKLSERSDVKLILFTCSHQVEIDQYIKLFEESGIHFDYVNENPEVKTDTDGYGNYDKKMYMNVLLDDKAGFDPENDWRRIKSLLRKYPI